MKRSDFFLRLTVAVLFVAIASYISIYMLNAVRNTFVTTTAISYTIEETAPARGYAVRSETVLTGGEGMLLPVVDEGVKVAAGGAVAIDFRGREALETASEINALRLRIARIEQSAGSDVTAMSLSSVVDLSRAVSANRLDRLDELSLQIETYVFANSLTESELPYLRAQLAILEGQAHDMQTIYAPQSGLFSQFVDGFESITPDSLHGLTPSILEELFASPPVSVSDAAGKLVTDHLWYFAAVMYAEDAARLQARQRIAVQFSGTYHASIDMLVEHISRSEDGLSAVIFSSNRNLRDIAPLRSLRAEVVFYETTGIRVPKEAIHLDDYGRTFVFIQAGVRAERVNVDILLSSADSFLVRGLPRTDGEPSTLRPGATVIVRANNLYHNKILS